MPRTQQNSVESELDVKKDKKLDEYQQSKPAQLTFFELLLPREERYSNTVELYDFIPKYHWGKAERVNGIYLKSLEREFECRGQRYRVTIKPASIKDSTGEEKYFYPSKREELVEDALRKIACEGQGLFLDDQAAVTFTLYQLQKELEEHGHSYSKNELKDSLLICAQTNLIVTTEDGKAVVVSSLFETLGLQTREDWEGIGQKTKAFVRFNRLVTQSIKHGTFRRFDYEKSMTYRSVIARQLHKRMAHHYTQASITNTYSILLSTIIRDFGLTSYEWPSHNLRNVVLALDEMKDKEVLLNYSVEKTLDSKQRNKLVDAKLILTPHPNFASETMYANSQQKGVFETPAKKQIGRFESGK